MPEFAKAHLPESGIHSFSEGGPPDSRLSRKGKERGNSEKEVLEEGKGGVKGLERGEAKAQRERNGGRGWHSPNKNVPVHR